MLGNLFKNSRPLLARVRQFSLYGKPEFPPTHSKHHGGQTGHGGAGSFQPYQQSGHSKVEEQAAARKIVDRWSRHKPIRLNMGKWTAWGQRSREEIEHESLHFLIRELPVRISHLFLGLEALPAALKASPQFQTLFGHYCTTLLELQHFGDYSSHLRGGSLSSEDLSAFHRVLDKIHTNHSSVVMLLSAALQEYKASLAEPATPAEQKALNHILDSIFLIRIGVRVLISQHLVLFPVQNTPQPSRKWVGLIDIECQPSAVTRDAVADARFLASQLFIDVPEVNIVGSPTSLETKFPYIPSHLHHIVFELTKNALRATIETHSAAFEAGEKYPPITLVLSKGDADLTIKIADIGGGFPRSSVSRIFDYGFTTATRPVQPEFSDMNNAPLAGFGYGLPLSRLYARYLGGDIQLISMDGYGCDAYVFLRHLAEDTVETCPYYSHSKGNWIWSER